jgi:Zn-dependent protease
VLQTESALAAPAPVFNCPNCSLWLPPGTLACPDCHAIVYGPHLDSIARRAVQLEGEDKWAEARLTWNSALEWLPPGTKQAAIVQGRIDQIDARRKASEDTKAKWTRRLGPLAPFVFFLAKAKTFLLALLKFKFLLSFVAFFGIYWALFGWKFGLGFTLSILIHELGHYVAVRRKGLKADLPVFLPGLGAYVRWYAAGMSLADLAEIALAGPAAGLLAAFACLGLYHWFGTGSTAELFGALANAAAWLNLLNLIPVLGLDGAQATYALDRTQRALVVGTCIVLFVLVHHMVYLLIAAGMTWRLFTPAPERPNTRTMVSFMMLLFLLGIVVWMAPVTPR